MQPKAEIEAWHALVRAQLDYAQSLAGLDALALDSTNSLPAVQRLIEEAAQVRWAAYTRYRQAMEQLSIVLSTQI
jgi:hypothetical protein